MTKQQRIAWSVLTIGHLSRNRFWGEDDSIARRSPLCTSALLRAGDAIILVDPALQPPEMPGLLDRRAGLKVSDVTHVYLTHFHGDHRFGLEAFDGIPWLLPDTELDFWSSRTGSAGNAQHLLDRMTPVAAEGGEIVPGIQTIHLPGHTPGLAGLVFDDRDKRRVVLAADAAMTRDFFEARAGYFNSHDFGAVAHSIDRLREQADVLLPGHDNFFWNERTPQPHPTQPRTPQPRTDPAGGLA